MNYGIHYAMGYSEEEKQELLGILKDYPKYVDRIKNSQGYSGFFSAPIPFSMSAENSLIQMTGIPPSLEEAKRLNRDALGTIGYFYDEKNILRPAHEIKEYL